jgi:hypothetical protein
VPAKVRPRLSPSGSFLRLAYSAPAHEEADAAETSRYALTAAKSLPFVKLRANDQPMWQPHSFWHVRPTGKREHDFQIGRAHARKAIAAMKADRNTALISQIIRDMLEEGVERAAKTGRRRHDPIMLGFLAEISQCLAGAP